MTLQQLKYVITVSETLNITQAAEQLFVSQPSLTKSINELEKEMNIKIFNRNNKGVSVTREGDLFLTYARQITEQASFMEEQFKEGHLQNPQFSVSCQHYSFVVEAMVETIKQFDGLKYNFTLRETQTHEIIEDVRLLKSEIGILYYSSQNRQIIMNLIKKNDLVFEELCTVRAHVFLSKNHPLAGEKKLTLEKLAEYPYLSFEQGDYNSFYYSEEILSTVSRPKNIRVRDRATMVDFIVGLNGYTVCSGLNSEVLNGTSIKSIPLEEDEYMTIGYIRQNKMPLGPYANVFLDELRKNIDDNSKKM